MRLTKAMKFSLLNVIRNKTKHPFKVQEDSITKELQDYIYKKEPVFKQYLDLYETPPFHRFREDLLINSKSDQLIYLIVPSHYYIKGLIGQVKSYKRSEFPVVDKNPDYEIDSDFEPIYNKLVQLSEDCEEYENVLSNLAITIDNCTTDTQLSEMYPEFVKYFNKAGITKTPATKQLPATLGLPDALIKFGLEIETKEEKEAKLNNLEEQIRKDIQEDNK